MEVQNISGSDIIQSGLSVNSSVRSENIKPEKQEPQENTPKLEQEKGNNIDTKA